MTEMLRGDIEMLTKYDTRVNIIKKAENHTEKGVRA
jgi:hypothetical protein